MLRKAKEICRKTWNRLERLRKGAGNAGKAKGW
jgi:hypothetical protein